MFRPMSFVQSLKERIDRWRNPPSHWITASESAFDICGAKGVEFTAEYARIAKIIAYQRNEFAGDPICVEIHQDSEANTAPVFIQEDVPGFDDLEQQLQSLPGYVPDWREDVVPTRFATHLTTIFERDQADP